MADDNKGAASSAAGTAGEASGATARAGQGTATNGPGHGDEINPGAEAGGGSGGSGGAGSAQQMGDRMRAGGEQMAQSSQQLGLKMLEQAESNTREAFRAMRDAAQAKDVAEIMRIQSEFMRDAGSRSMSQAREIGEMIVGFGRDAAGQFTGRR